MIIDANCLLEKSYWGMNTLKEHSKEYFLMERDSS